LNLWRCHPNGGLKGPQGRRQIGRNLTQPTRR
jgi:hypothetical protein